MAPRPQILVVDDDPSIVELIRLNLESDGADVIPAYGGAECLAVLERQRPDVIVLDIMMPNVDGWMVLMNIRDNPKTADIPVIMLTAKTQDLAKILAFRQGAQQYVTKPFSPAELSVRVQSLVGTRVTKATGAAPTTKMDGLQKIAVRRGGKTMLVPMEDVVFISARNKSTYVHTADEQFLTDSSLGELADKFDPLGFHRAHRSYVINLNKIKEIVHDGGEHFVVLQDSEETRVKIARRQVRRFRQAVGL